MIKPVPDRDSAEWWERAARHEFVVQACGTCGTLRFPARAYCARCRGREWHWREVAPAGRVVSWIVNHQPFLPDAPTPYTVVMVRLTDAPACVMVGNWHGPAEPVADQPVTVSYTYVDERLSLINWEPA
ncbi:Zn-ribbon domain-containing OB-fold protein [Sphaerisporangium corydalis]|uniref:Zn-ribbon domain-containing OB-fold protein n=1 Tax=Sphaerisporangium corydalis TaxID=1441875 RepID=A0ABV9E7D6_9ACTN|nr:zinc ribbon domain-containing protein [Sphaerisporangium corydalis]